MGAKVPLRNVKARYGAMTVFAKDSGAVTHSLLSYGEWAQREIDFITSLFEPGSTVLDVGAYIGTHTLAFAHRTGEAGVVHAFEPQPCSFELLERNVKGRGLTQVHLHHAAVSDQARIVEFVPIDPSREASFGSASLTEVLKGNTGGPKGGEAKVAATTIDALDLSQCDIVKIDVEGSEDLVLRGAGRTIERCRPTIYAECNSVDAGIRIAELLRAHGYTLRLHLSPAFNPENFADARQNIFGSAREAAIVGMPSGRELLERQNVPPEVLLPLETIDDLVVGLLNKPQYVDEVLEKTAAATLMRALSIEGASDALHSARQAEIEQLEKRVQMAQAAVQESQKIAAEAQTEVMRLTQRLEASRVHGESAKARAAEQERAANAASAKADAAMLQAAVSRRSADRATAEALLHKEQRERIQMSLTRAEARTSEILNSTSWRLTAPMRRLVRLVRGH